MTESQSLREFAKFVKKSDVNFFEEIGSGGGFETILVDVHRSDLVTLKAVFESANEMNVSVIIGASEGEREFMGVR